MRRALVAKAMLLITPTCPVRRQMLSPMWDVVLYSFYTSEHCEIKLLKGPNLIGCSSCSERNAGGRCCCCRHSGGRSTVHHGNFSVGSHGSDITGGWSVYVTMATCGGGVAGITATSHVTSWKDTPGHGMQSQCKAKQHQEGKNKREKRGKSQLQL